MHIWPAVLVAFESKKPPRQSKTKQKKPHQVFRILVSKALKVIVNISIGDIPTIYVSFYNEILQGPGSPVGEYE